MNINVNIKNMNLSTLKRIILLMLLTFLLNSSCKCNDVPTDQGCNASENVVGLFTIALAEMGTPGNGNP